MDEAKLERFGTLVRQRRLELGLTQDQVAAAGGPSDKRQTQIEKGASPAPSITTQAKVDTGLQWKPGSAAATLRGGTPTNLEDDEPAITEEDVDRAVNLALALERTGVTQVGTRGAHRNANRGLSNEVIDQLIELLNSLPPANRTAE